jgi:hypothetical protein
MTHEEIEDLKEKIEKYEKKVTKSKKASRSFLVELGIFTKSGKLTKNYENLCIPLDHD